MADSARRPCQSCLPKLGLGLKLGAGAVAYHAWGWGWGMSYLELELEIGGICSLRACLFCEENPKLWRMKPEMQWCYRDEDFGGSILPRLLGGEAAPEIQKPIPRQDCKYVSIALGYFTNLTHVKIAKKELLLQCAYGYCHAHISNILSQTQSRWPMPTHKINPGGACQIT